MIAQRVLQACLDLGVREFVLCAGSRNSDLMHGLFQCKAEITRYSFFEERSAAFFALGRLQAQRRPVVVITTSGTAAAELLPAVIEAYYQARPLIVVTADRPKSFRGTGAPQAIEQVELFGCYARCVDLAEGDLPDLSLSGQPLHLNVCLEEPAASVPEITLRIEERPSALAVPERSRDDDALTSFLEKPGDLLVVAGCLDPDERLIEWLRNLNVPILADATSGLHRAPALRSLILRGGDQTARQVTFHKVLRLGGVPSFRLWRDLETRPDVAVMSLSQRPFSGLARHSEMIIGRVVGSDPCPVASAPRDWQAIESMQAGVLDRLLDRFPTSEPAHLRRLVARIPWTARVFVGNSQPIRELSLVAARALSQAIHANRGANGIDGNLATFFGLAADSEEAWGIFGDLTTLYDLAAPGILTQLPNVRIRIVVVNNGGGKIFQRLPNFKGLDPDRTAMVENHHAFDFRRWAQAWGLSYHRIASSSDLLQEWGQHAVLEIRPCDDETKAFWDAYGRKS